MTTRAHIFFTMLVALSDHLPIFLFAVLIVAVGVSVSYFESNVNVERPFKGFPLVGLEEEGLAPREAWNKNGYKVVAKGLREHPGAFQVMTGTGPKIILPNRFAEEFGRRDGVSMLKSFGLDFFTGWPGFDGVDFIDQHEQVFADTVRINLTQSLGLVTDALVKETRASVLEYFGNENAWRGVLIKENVGQLVARLSSRVFLGPELCRNKEWLQIAENYTVDLFYGSLALKAMPAITRPITYWLDPHCTRLRKHARDARRLIAPLVRQRREKVIKAMATGKVPEKVADTIGWMVGQAKGRNIDYAAGQLGMSVAGIHTTTEAISVALVDLCNHPGLLEPLRKEVVAVLEGEEWSKASLYKMRLMDSFLKESQRMHPPSGTTMNRVILRDTELSDGTLLQKGTRLFIAGRFSDPALYPDPDTFDAYRFLRLRTNSGRDNSWQLTSTSPEHLGFGYGNHSCPGRFFATHETKIALSFLLLKYDWEMSDGKDNPSFMTFGTGTVLNPKCRVRFRRRREEIEL